MNFVSKVINKDHDSVAIHRCVCFHFSVSQVYHFFSQITLDLYIALMLNFYRETKLETFRARVNGWKAQAKAKA